MTYFTKRGAPLKNPLLDIISSQRGNGAAASGFYFVEEEFM